MVQQEGVAVLAHFQPGAVQRPQLAPDRFTADTLEDALHRHARRGLTQQRRAQIVQREGEGHEADAFPRPGQRVAEGRREVVLRPEVNGDAPRLRLNRSRLALWRARPETPLREHLVKLGLIAAGSFRRAQLQQVVVVAIHAVDCQVHRARPDAERVDEDELVVHQRAAAVVHHRNARRLQLIDETVRGAQAMLVIGHDAHPQTARRRRQNRLGQQRVVQFEGGDVERDAGRIHGRRQRAVNAASVVRHVVTARGRAEIHRPVVADHAEAARQTQGPGGRGQALPGRGGVPQANWRRGRRQRQLQRQRDYQRGEEEACQMPRRSAHAQYLPGRGMLHCSGHREAVRLTSL